MKIPTWEEAYIAIDKHQDTPIDVFIVNNEPAGVEEEKKFRDELQSLIDFVLDMV